MLREERERNNENKILHFEKKNPKIKKVAR